jgi:hypothetical protein
MTEVEAHEAIRQRWKTGWEALHPADTGDPDHVPFTFENESFDAVAAWVHVAIEPTVRGRTTQGREHGRYSSRGIVRVRIFADANAGADAITELASEVIAVLEDVRITDVILREGSTRMGPTDGRWVMRVVTVPFELRT